MSNMYCGLNSSNLPEIEYSAQIAVVNDFGLHKKRKKKINEIAS
jgi:hypothetical protein